MLILLGVELLEQGKLLSLPPIANMMPIPTMKQTLLGVRIVLLGLFLAVAIKAAKAQEHRLQAGMDARQAPATAPAMAGTNVANILEPHTPVPEPSSLVLGGAGIGAMLVLRRLLFR